MAVVQLLPSLLVKRRAGIQTLHRFIGYAFVPVFILELIIGLFRARVL
jgi:cytochrome b